MNHTEVKLYSIVLCNSYFTFSSKKKDNLFTIKNNNWKYDCQIEK